MAGPVLRHREGDEIALPIHVFDPQCCEVAPPGSGVARCKDVAPEPRIRVCEQARSLLRRQPPDAPLRLPNLRDEARRIVRQVAPRRELMAEMFESDRILICRAGRPHLDTLRPLGFQEIGAHRAQPAIVEFGNQRFQDVTISILAGRGEAGTADRPVTLRNDSTQVGLRPNRHCQGDRFRGARTGRLDRHDGVITDGVSR